MNNHIATYTVSDENFLTKIWVELYNIRSHDIFIQHLAFQTNNCLSLSYVSYVASFSGLFFFDCLFGILWIVLFWLPFDILLPLFIYNRLIWSLVFDLKKQMYVSLFISLHHICYPCPPPTHIEGLRIPVYTHVLIKYIFSDTRLSISKLYNLSYTGRSLLIAFPCLHWL